MMMIAEIVRYGPGARLRARGRDESRPIAIKLTYVRMAAQDVVSNTSANHKPGHRAARRPRPGAGRTPAGGGRHPRQACAGCPFWRSGLAEIAVRAHLTIITLTAMGRDESRPYTGRYRSQSAKFMIARLQCPVPKQIRKVHHRTRTAPSLVQSFGNPLLV